MIEAVVLDSGVLTLVTQRVGVATADECRRWVAQTVRAGARMVVPAIANYEARRELVRAAKAASVSRLDTFIRAEPDRYLRLTDADLHLAAELWASARRQGLPTADARRWT